MNGDTESMAHGSMAFGIISVSLAIVLAVTVEGFLGGSGRRRMTKMSLASTASPSSASSTSNTGRASNDDKVLGVIFDIDGTLANSWNLGYQATLTVLADYSNVHTPQTYPLTPEEYHFGCRYTTPERLARHVGLEPDVDPTFMSVGNELGRKFDEHYVRLVDKTTAGFYNGIGDLLVKLHRGELSSRSNGRVDGTSTGVKLGALTNACVEYAHAVLKANCPKECSSDSSVNTKDDDSIDSIYHRFSSIHGANSVPRPKPYGDGILQCCKEMDIPPAQVIYVGDAPTDARAAVNARCRAAIGVLWGSNDEECLKQEAGFTVLVRDVEELGRAIENYL